MTFLRAPRGRRRRGIADLRKAVASFDPNLPVIYTQTLKEATAVGLLPQRLAAWIAASVGTIGLLLAALGLYGLTAFSVAQRTREIALRMALGARREDVIALVLAQSGRLAAGRHEVIGLALAAGVSMLLREPVGRHRRDRSARVRRRHLVLIAVLLAATWAPARRAASMDPMRALRAE